MKKYFIPEFLYINLNDILITNGYDRLAKSHLIKFYYIIDKLYLEHHINKLYDKYSFINLHSKIIGNLFGKCYYKNIMDTLEKLEIIECDKDYSIGNYSFGYRLSKHYLESKVILIEDTSKFSNKVMNIKLMKLDNLTLLDRTYHLLLMNIKDTRLNYSKINYLINKKRLKYNNLYLSNNTLMCPDLIVNEKETNINKLVNLSSLLTNYDLMLPEVKNYYNDRNLVNLSKKKIKTKDKYELESYQDMIISIINLLRIEYDPQHLDGLHFSIDNKGHRCHNNITNLNSEVRDCLYQQYNINTILSNCDLKCSQILMLIMYLKNKYPNFYAYQDFITLEDFYNNDFYTSCMKDLNYPVINDITRKEFKSEFFAKIYFGRNYSNNISDWFSKKFPKVFQIINELKKVHYSNFAIQMQRTESTFIFHELNKIIEYKDNEGNKPFKDLYFLTIHDSIVVPIQYSEMVKQVLERQINNRYGITHTIKTEHLNKLKDIKMIDKDKLKELNSKLNLLEFKEIKIEIIEDKKEIDISEELLNKINLLNKKLGIKEYEI